MQDDKTPFNIQPLEGYQEFLQTVPDFENFKLQSITTLESWFNKFPLCCDKHKDLENESWFNKSDYNNVVAKIFNQQLYTIHCIYKNKDEKEWYDLITEYLEDNLASFGEFEKYYYGNCGGDQYHKWVKLHVERHITENEKKESLLSFLSIYNSSGIHIDKDYKETCYKIGKILSMAKIFYPQVNDNFRNILNPLFTWKQSRYTDRYQLKYPNIREIKGKFMELANSVKSKIINDRLYLIGLFEGTKTKDGIITLIVLNQTELRNNDFQHNDMNFINDEMIDLLERTKTAIETLPESNFKLSPKSKLNEQTKGFDLGLSVPQLEKLHSLLIDNKFLIRCEFKHFKNTFNDEVLADDFKPLKWKVSYYASIFVTHHIEHKTPWQIAVQVFDNGTSDSLKNAYDPKSLTLSNNQKNAKVLLDDILKSLQ